VLNIGSVSLESTSFAMSALGGGGGTMSTTLQQHCLSQRNGGT
jgi:hypothetical protein